MDFTYKLPDNRDYTEEELKSLVETVKARDHKVTNMEIYEQWEFNKQFIHRFKWMPVGYNLPIYGAMQNSC